MGFGTGPFGSSPFGAQSATPPAETAVDLVSSRLITARKRVVVKTDGGYEAMDDVAQAAVLLIAFEAGDRPAIIEPRTFEQRRQALRTALAPLTRGTEPKIRILEILVTSPRAGVFEEKVVFQNLLTNTKLTATPL